MNAFHKLLRTLRDTPRVDAPAPPSAPAEEWRVTASEDLAPEGVAGAFSVEYAHAPSGVWRAPGRVNLMGEHTDYNDGLVLPVALPWGVTLALAPADDGVVEVRSAQVRGSDTPRFTTAGLDPAACDLPPWARYVAGVFWAARAAGHLDPGAGARILLDSDLPVGAALSSSAALECATLAALVDTYDLSGLTGDLPAMAELARRAENDFVGAPTGILDQSASLRCAEGHALFLDCRTGGGRNVPLALEEAGLRLLIIDTRVRHSLSDPAGGYAARRAECERAAEHLGVAALRDVEDLDTALDTLSDPVLRRRVRHVVTEIHRVNAAVGLMRAGALPHLGAVFNASHLSMRDDFEISSPELDTAVDSAVRAGARGARMTGGGFGGSAVALVDADRVAAVRDAVGTAFTANGWAAPEFRVALPSRGAHRLR